MNFAKHIYILGVVLFLATSCATFVHSDKDDTELSSRDLASADAVARGAGNSAARKIVIFYSDTGGGHSTAKDALMAGILAKDPTAQVVPVNIWQFSPQWFPEVKRWLWSKVLHKAPQLRDWGYARAMRVGNETPNLADVTQYHVMFNKDAAYEFLAKERPDAVIATNYSGAEILRVLRQEGNLPVTDVGWVMTDYGKGYWPRVSQFLDKTFLPHPDMAATWKENGVHEKKVAVTGLPLNSAVATPADREAVLASYGLNPQVKTILIGGGSDGAAPYEKIMKTIVQQAKGRVQIVALCGSNDKALKALEKMSEHLPQNIRLRAFPKVKQNELLDLVKSSDVYVAKAGGLSPSEGFAIGKPMVIYNLPGGGVEVSNTDFIQEKGLALTTRDTNQIGKLAVHLLDDQASQKKILEAQAKFRAGMNLGPMVDFALGSGDSGRVPAHVPNVNARLLEENRARYLIDEAEAFAGRVQLFREATGRIDYNSYIWRMDDIGKAQLKMIRDAARRGVKIRIVMDSQGGRKVPLAMMKHLQDEGVQFKMYHPQRFSDLANYHRRMHDKFVSADSNRIIVGGRNAQNSYYQITPKKNRVNFDDVELYGEGNDARSADTYFDGLYNSADVEDVPGINDVKAADVRKQAKVLNKISDADVDKLSRDWAGRDVLGKTHKVKGFKVLGTLRNQKDLTKGIATDIYQMMRRAQKEFVFISPYFILTDELRDEIIDLNKRGVKLTVLTNSTKSMDNFAINAGFRRDLAWLESMGVEVHEYKGPNMLHTKIFFRDGGEEIYNGSYNVDNRSQKLNSEMGAIFELEPGTEGKAMSDELVTYSKSVIAKSVPVTGPKRVRPRTVLGCTRDFLLQLLVSNKAVRDFL